jgi:prepilin-type N-terminal cleavage/methylation domain-containing protein
VIRPRRRRATSQARHSDNGFTLIELLMTVVIIGVITIPLGNLVISYFLNTANTQARLGGSHDEQIAAAYFAQDVASMGSHATATSTGIWVTPYSGAPGCGNVAGVSRVLVLASDDYSAAAAPFNGTAVPQVTYVAYVAKPAGTLYELHRVRCAGPGATGGIDTTVMHNLTAVPVTPLCDAATCSAATTYPAKVTIQTVVKDSSATGGTLPVDLSGLRRQS